MTDPCAQTVHVRIENLDWKALMDWMDNLPQRAKFRNLRSGS